MHICKCTNLSESRRVYTSENDNIYIGQIKRIAQLLHTTNDANDNSLFVCMI